MNFDNKEAIPEMFLFPEMFLNVNKFDYGMDYRGRTVNDCSLPEWCLKDPRYFVKMHKKALDGPIVT